MRLTDQEPDEDGEVYAVVTLQDGQIRDVEFLSRPPKWSLRPLHQMCFVGNVDGGDALELELCDVEECDGLATELWEIPDEDEPEQLCIDHYDARCLESYLANLHPGPDTATPPIQEYPWQVGVVVYRTFQDAQDAAIAASQQYPSNEVQVRNREADFVVFTYQNGEYLR